MDPDRFTRYRTAQAIGDLARAGGDSGGAAATGAGLGLGVTMAQLFSQALSPPQAAQPGIATPVEGTTTCPDGHVVAREAKFCPQCGARIEQQLPGRCPNGHPVPPGAKFCPECGAQVG